MIPDSTDSTPEKAMPGWVNAFLHQLGQSGDVSASADAAGVHRTTVYALRKRSTEFREAWSIAEDEGADALEAEARKRALAGSDTLLIFLLKAHRPNKYRERVATEHSGRVEVHVTYDDDANPPDAPEATPGPADGTGE